ncbi:pheromone receptor Rcb2 B43 [Mycena leptocephala]|nr:pheromone receptor Rcb2 B43 [Mycena leptocephala]
MHPEFAPVAFIAAFSLVLPLPWHWRARNVATLSIIAWLFVTNIIFAVDALIWSQSVDLVALVWCDISVKLIVGGNFALPAACLCICIHLEQVSSVRAVRVTSTDRKRRQIFEACMCFGLPILFMALHYVVQGHRFDIIEDYGCRPSTYYSIPAIFIVWIPPLLMATASLVFASLALRHFIQRRITFAAHLDANHSALTTSRYLRLMLMSVLQMIWSISLTIFTLWFTTTSLPLRPWTTWADVHSNFSRVDQYPTLFTPQIILSSYYALWWTVPASTFIFVAFFAFGHEAMVEYKKGFTWFRRTVLRQNVGAPSASKGFGSLVSSKSQQGGAISLGSLGDKAKPIPSPSSSRYPLPSPPSPSKYRSHLDDFDFDDVDTRSEVSESTVGPALSYQHDSDSTPSTPAHPPPPPGVARPRTGSESTTTTSPRPYTYPSFHASHRSIPIPIPVPPHDAV